MAGPGLPVNTDTSYADTGTADVKLHQQHHDALHGIANDFDTANVGTVGYVPIGNGTVFVSRALLSTDQPTIVINQFAASHTLALSDLGALVYMNVAGANSLTVPLNSSVAFPIGGQVAWVQYGAGLTTIVATGGVSIRAKGGSLASSGQYADGMLTKLATDEWLLSGYLA